MAENSWIVVGISGVTGGGKTTLANKINENFPNSRIINQDKYFHRSNSPHHVKIPNTDRINYELLSSLNMEQLYADIVKIISEPNEKSNKKSVLIVDGFTVLNYKPVKEICDLKYQLFLTKDECWRRRCLRNYKVPDMPGYFDDCVWPAFNKYMDELKMYSDIVYIDGTATDSYDKLSRDIESLIK